LIKIIIYIIYFIFAASALLNGQTTIFNHEPDWISEPLGHVATGLGIADINQDGWDDIVVANGNDIEPQHLCVYYNLGNGTFHDNPSWVSEDTDFHGHLAIGDINGDNRMDVAVSVLAREKYPYSPGYVKVYFNKGVELEALPAYSTADSMFTFSCALGDADGDGDLDLAVACGFSEIFTQTYNRIYYNENGELQRLPGWKSDVFMNSLDVDFADMDCNGYLDLVFINYPSPDYIFFADASGSIQTSPGWKSQVPHYRGNSLVISILDDNEYLDLVVSGHNSSIYGNYIAYLFDSPPGGMSYPQWGDLIFAYGSAILADDFNGDGWNDLAGGVWWGPMRLYLGTRDGLESEPFWISNTYTVAEAFASRDLDQDGRFPVQDTIDVSLDSAHCVYLSGNNIEKINSVMLNGHYMNPVTDYCTTPGARWISTTCPLSKGDQFILDYVASSDRDLVVTNFDRDIGNYIFYNQHVTSSVKNEKEELENTVQVFPNPFNTRCVFRITNSPNHNGSVQIFEISGRLVKTIGFNARHFGTQEIVWDGRDENGKIIPSGLYIYRIIHDRRSIFGKMTCLR
jgi:hypothetical protein